MIEAYTINESAYSCGNPTGSLKKGKYTDLIVLDQNLFEISPYEIHR